MKITDPAQLISRGHRWGQGFIMICMCQQQNLWRRSFWGVIHEGSAFPESGWEPRSESGNICTSQGWEQYEAMMKKLTNLMDYCSHPKTPSYPLQVIQFWPWLHAQKWDTMGHHGTPRKLASVCNTPKCAELCLPVSPGRSSDHTRWLSELPYARLWPWLTQQID